MLSNSTENITQLEHSPSKGGAPPSAVYYPPGNLYSADSQHTEVDVNPSTDRKKKKEKKFRNDGDYEDKQGAAVVPICLPLCCAAPCVIL